MRVTERILVAPVYGYRWMLAVGYVGKEQFEKASHTLARLAKHAEGRSPKFHILRAFVEHMLEHDSQAIADLDRALAILPYKRRLSSEDRAYLQVYCRLLKRRINETIGHSEDKSEETDLSGIDLDRVSAATKRNFPMRSHPDWNKGRQ